VTCGRWCTFVIKDNTTRRLNGNGFGLAIDDGNAIISVTDNGPGIPVDECQHVLKRFYRLEQSRRTPGNGLGLSLVAAVARLHGASIEMVDNAPGLKFQLRFPLHTGLGFENVDVPGKRGWLA
jgi:K+-sensing histidine kinase KdpD